MSEDLPPDLAPAPEGEDASAQTPGPAGDDGSAVAGPPPQGRRRRRVVLEWAVVLLAALLLAFGIRAFAVQAFFIPSASMEPTLTIGQRVLVSRLSGPKVGDVGGFGLDGEDS